MKTTYADLNVPGAAVLAPRCINILLGKNGAGKSRFLRVFDEALASNPEYRTRYISPERAGVFRRDGNVLTQMENDPTWLGRSRRRNQVENFKAASANLLREVELLYLRRLQNDPLVRGDISRSFETDRIDKINRLLSDVFIVRDERGDYLFETAEGSRFTADQLSSGQSEALALAVEILYFFDTLQNGPVNILFLDEPDVHLHPDLQARLARFVIELAAELDDQMRRKVMVLIATHSTPLTCAFVVSELVGVGTKEVGVEEVRFRPVGDQIRKVAPFFGHPLSQAFNRDPLLIVEGEDDERVWQQAARSSGGRIRVFPVVAGSVDVQTELETVCSRMIASIYDEPIAFSLRDSDGKTDALEPIGPVRRFRLGCYAIENVLLSDEGLSALGTTWAQFQETLAAWCESHHSHRDYACVDELRASGDRLRYRKIKAVRQLLCAIAESTKPWEVVVGQAIAGASLSASGEFALSEFLGRDALQALCAVQA